MTPFWFIYLLTHPCPLSRGESHWALLFVLVLFIYIKKIRHIPDISMQANASGVSTFQHRFISWSTRRRGNVHRIHIWTPTRVKLFTSIQMMPQPLPVVQLAKCTTPTFGSGVFHAPKNRTTLIIDTKTSWNTLKKTRMQNASRYIRCENRLRVLILLREYQTEPGYFRLMRL